MFFAFFCSKPYIVCMTKQYSQYQTSQRARQKEIVSRFLQSHDITSILKWAQTVRNPLSILSSMLFSNDQLLVWRTIDALGHVTALLDKNRHDTIHQLVRHNFWMMNDESGNIGWHAPETIGEILYHVPTLIPEFGKLLLSYTDEEPFERGTHWAIARVSQRQPSVYADSIDIIIPSLKNPDAQVRGYTLLTLQWINPSDVIQEIKELTGDTSAFDWYDSNTGMIQKETVGEIAKNIMSQFSTE